MKNKNYEFEVKAKNENGNLILFLKIDKEIEELLKSDERESMSWKDENDNNLKFYKFDNNNELHNFLNNKKFYYGNYEVWVDFDNYGNGLISNLGNNRISINASILRTVGLSQGIKFKVTSLINCEQLQLYLNTLTETIKILIEKINECNYVIEAKINIIKI